MAQQRKMLGGLGSSGNTTSKGLDKATNSAKGLNKALHGLASFDEMNVLKENTDNDSGSSVGENLSGIDLSAFDIRESILKSINNNFDNLNLLFD